MKWTGPLSVLGASLLAACAGPSTRESLVVLPPAPAGKVVVRDYVDVHKNNGVDEYFRIRYVWDYDQQVAVMERLNLEGELLESVAEPGLTLVTTDAELDYAIALVRNDPVLRKQFMRDDLHFHGGFSVREPALAGCNEGSRCVRIFVSAGSRDEVPIAKAIVDLASRRVIDRGDFDAAM